MRIEQATYGLTRNGHSLLQSSGDIEFAKELERRMDLPNTAPHGIAWSPYLSGFPWRDRYILSKTELDMRATRGGVVFTHAIFLPAEEAVLVKNIDPFVRYLAQRSTADNTEVTTIEIPTADPKVISRSDALIAAINELFSRGAGPGVWIGTDGFDELVVALWAVLWPELRRTFGFRLSFGPDDLIEVPRPDLVVTPQGLAARWIHHKVIDRSTAAQVPSPITSALLDSEADPQLRYLVRTFGLRISGFQDLALINHLQRLIGSHDFESLISALRIIETLSSSAEIGREAKAELLNRVLAKIPEIETSQTLPLRNLELTKLEGASALWTELRQRIASAKLEPRDDPAFRELARDALMGSASIESWSDAVKNGIIDASRKSEKHFTAACWRLLLSQTEVGIAVFSLLPRDHQIEAAFVDSIPGKLPETAVSQVLSICKQKRWLCLHGAVLNRSYDLLEALKKQLAIDTDQSSIQGLALALGDAPPQDVVLGAQRIGDARLISMASERVAASPSVLGDEDFSLPSTQAIWAGAISKSPSCWKAPRHPQSAVAIVLDCLIDKRPIFSPVVDEIALTPLADVSSFPRRSLVWEKLAGRTKELFLSATAKGFIDSLILSQIPQRPEPMLEAAVLANEHTYEALAFVMQQQLTLALDLVSAFPSFSEQQFERLLTRRLSTVHHLPKSESQVLGLWVKQRAWRTIANWMLGRSLHGRSDLRPALTQCAELFPWWTRFRYEISSASSDDKWAALQEIAAKLYPSGPDHNELWERSGGKNQELEYWRDGNGRWTAALNRVRRGNEVDVARLISEMRREYSGNEELRFLSEDREFGGWRK